MQANEFEKKIQNKLEGFALVPNEEVWKQVAARIHAEKRRRRFVFFWFFTGFLLLGGAGGWWFIDQENKVLSADVSSKADQHSSVPTPSPVATPHKAERVYTEKKSLQKDKAVIATGNVEENNITEAISTDRRYASQKKNNSGKTVKSEKVSSNELSTEKKIKIQQSKPAPENPDTDITAKKERLSLVPSDQIDKNGLSNLQADTAVITAEEKSTSAKDTSDSLILMNKPLLNPEKGKLKRWNFGIAAYAGLSDNLSGFPLSSQNKSLLYDAAPVNNNTPGGGFNASITPLTYTTGFSFGFGLYTSLQLKKKIGLSLGLDYHYYSAVSSVGSRVSSQLSLFDSVLQQSVSRDNFYSNGRSVTLSNSYHFIELPINLLWQVNKNQNRPLLLTAGISPGLLAGSSALYANQSERIYYVEKDQFRRFHLSAQAGVLFNFLNAKKFRINAGPVLQYGFTNLSRPETGKHQHLFFTGLKTNISLK